MRSHYSCWPWRAAYAGHVQSSKPYESRWHHRRGADFGVRRPLRYLAHHLDLDESQMRRMAQVLNQLKTERDQAELDEKRTVTALADLLAEGTPTLEDAKRALEARTVSAQRLTEETAQAVVTISSFLDDDQQVQFVNLLLTGAISF